MIYLNQLFYTYYTSIEKKAAYFYCLESYIYKVITPPKKNLATAVYLTIDITSH